MKHNLFCPNCGHLNLEQFPPNRPASDFYCDHCGQEYELKSRKRPFGKSIVNGAYATLMNKLHSGSAPNLVLLHYDPVAWAVSHLEIVPRRFFVPSLITARKPLSPSARRAGWIGSTINLGGLPKLGRIRLVWDGSQMQKGKVLEDWKATAFLDAASLNAKSWLIDVLKCVDSIDREVFALDDLYAFETQLAGLHPKNRNVRPKIRQQLQVLRDKGFVEFLERGVYRRLR